MYNMNYSNAVLSRFGLRGCNVIDLPDNIEIVVDHPL
jgi:hypothetical protein